MGLEDYVREDEVKEEVAVVHLVNPSTIKRIDLVGAVHIGSQEYYDSVRELLNGCDAVLYERIIPGSGNHSLRDKFIFSNGIRLSEFYRNIAESVTRHYTEQITGAVEKVSKKAPDRIDLLNKYRDQLIGELRLVFQRDAIDYDNLPPNWYHADLTHDEMKAQVGIFSGANLVFGLLRFASNLGMKYQWVMDKLVEEIVTEGLISTGMDTNPIPQIDKVREAKVYEQVDALEQNTEINRIGVFYGVNHLPYLESELSKRGYMRYRIEYLELLRKKPKDLERFLIGKIN